MKSLEIKVKSNLWIESTAELKTGKGRALVLVIASAKLLLV